MSLVLRPMVYVAGPYTLGDPELNTEEAIDIGDKVWALGGVPFIPHFTHYWDRLHPHPYEMWMEYDFHFLHLCDALYRMAGTSGGADREVSTAEEVGIPVFKNLLALRKWIDECKTQNRVVGVKTS